MQNPAFTFCIAATLCLGLSFSVQAQHRPKVGLVLSGGGAKGMAHIGVLKVLERAGITPDYITGTSMGSVVGGLYAMGYSADELTTIVESLDWDEVLTNKVPLNEIAIEEKPFYNRYALELPVPKFFKIAFPGGIIEGEKLQQFFLDLTRPVHDIDNFNKLPIPFACVATDIATGKPVLLNKGSLAQCMRASMAIPTVFTPVEIDGKLLVDGGLVRNFPVQEVKDMGADIVIGVFVSNDLKSKEELDGFVDILFQTSWVLSAYDSRKQKEMVDYYIQPDQSGYGTADFKLSKIIIEKGELAAEEMYPTLKRLADSIYATEPPRKVVRPKAADTYALNKIEIEGNEKIPTQLIRGKLGLKEHTAVSSKDLEKQVSLLFGTQHYSSVGYQLHKSDSGHHNLEVNVKESAPGKLKAAIHYDTENKAGLNLNLTLRNLLLADSRAIAEVDLAEFPRATINYLKYTTKSQNIAAMGNVDYNNFSPRVLNSDGESQLVNVKQFIATATVFTTFSTNHTYGASIARNLLELKPQITGNFQDIEFIQNHGTTAQIFYQLNRLERPFYPRFGSKAFLSYTAFFDQTQTVQYQVDTVGNGSQPAKNIQRIDAEYMKIFRFTHTLSFITEARAAFSSHPNRELLNIIGATYFGGFRPRTSNSYSFYGAYNYDYTVSSYSMLKADLQAEITDHFYLTAGINYLDVVRPMKWFDDNYQTNADLIDGKKWRLGFGLSAGYMSIIGPISVTLAMDSQRQKVLANFSLGFYY